MKNIARDEVYTPDSALDIILPFLEDNSKVIYECAVGTGNIKNYFEGKGFNVVCGSDFFNDNINEFDIIVTNPPYSLKDEFLEKCYSLGKPFALLLPITALEGLKRQALYKKHGIEIIFPKGRIDFNGKKQVWFYTAWFTWKLNLPQTLNFL